MQKKVDSVAVKTPVKEISRLIFGSRINGVPVLHDKKVVGFITERDILAQFYPSMQEYIEDPVHARDFEGMEKKLNEILSLRAEKIMSGRPTTIKADAPLLKAYSLMTARKIGRLPVVDDKGRLIGIISKGDIFNYLVGSNIPFGVEENFFNWLTRHYDIYIDWQKRLESEIPDLVDLFKKEGIEKILDVASGTGEHVIALAQEGFEVFGVEASNLMLQVAEGKKAKIPQKVQERTHFLKGMYKDAIKELPSKIGAAIFMGNVLPHIIYTEKNILENLSKMLDPKKSILVFQMANFDLKLDKESGLKDFVVRKINGTLSDKQAFLSFYSEENGVMQGSLAIFESIGGKWMLQGLNSTIMKKIDYKELSEMLKKIGFSKIEVYGNQWYGKLFGEKFDPEKHNWLIVVAKR